MPVLLIGGGLVVYMLISKGNQAAKVAAPQQRIDPITGAIQTIIGSAADAASGALKSQSEQPTFVTSYE